MDGASPYHQVELQRWHTKIQRAQEDADFAAYEEKTLSDIQKEKDQKLAQLVADAKAEEAKLKAAEKEASDLLESHQQRELEDLLTKHEGQTALRKRDAEHATKQLTKKNEADKELLLSTYADKGFKAETEIQNQMQQRQLDRAMEDQTWSAELCRIADEQSRLTIEVQPRVVASTPAHAAEPLQRGHFQRRSVSAAAAVLESPVRGTELNMLMRGPETTQPRSRVSSVTPTKRTMADSPYENRTPPNLRRIVSDNITPAADGDIFTTSSSSASSGGLPSPTALLSRLPEFTQGATPARSVSISSASSQSTTQSPGQITQSPTPHSNRRQTIGTNGTSNGMNERLVDGFLQPQSSAQARSTSCATPPKFSLGGAVKPASQPQGISPSTPIPLSRATFQTNSSPLSASRGTTISVNFEIVSVRYSYASGMSPTSPVFRGYSPHVMLERPSIKFYI